MTGITLTDRQADRRPYNSLEIWHCVLYAVWNSDESLSYSGIRYIIQCA